MIPSILLTALKEGFQKLINEMRNVAKAIDKTDMTGAVEKQSKLLTTAVGRMERALDKIKEPKFTGEVVVDTSELIDEIRAVIPAIRDIGKKLPQLGTVERLLRNIAERRDPDDGRILTALNALTTAVKEKQLAIPKDLRVKLDDMQARSLGSGNGGGYIGGAMDRTAYNVTVANVSLANTATEYSYTFPANTVQFTVKLRDQGTLLYYAWAAGTLPNSGDGSSYMTAPQNYLRSIDGVMYGGKTLYFGAEAASQIAEIESFQM